MTTKASETKLMAKDPARCATGIAALDRILEGGIPQGNTVLLAGGSGLGKTTLACQFLCEGARLGEPSAIVSVAESSHMLKRNLAAFTFYKPQYVDENHLLLLDLRAIARKMGLESGMFRPTEHAALLETFRQICHDLAVKRLVIDSMTAICQWMQDPVQIRDFIFRLALALTDIGCTTILTSETPPRTLRFSMFDVEEFVSDGIIFLSEVEKGDRSHRALQVVKMRGTRHSRDRYYMDLTDHGIQLSPRPPTPTE